MSTERPRTLSSASSPIAPPLAELQGAVPPAPPWFVRALQSEPERSFTTVEGARVETLSWGPRGAPGVMLLHGNGAHADWWSFIAPLLANERRVTAISWSGMGGSDWRKAYSSDGYVDEIFACAHASGLFESRIRPVLIGHSYGGFPAMNAAAKRGNELAGIVAFDTPLWTPEMRAKRRSPRDPANEYKPSRVYGSVNEALERFRLMPAQPCGNLFIVDHIARRSLKEVRRDDGTTGFTWRFDPFLWKHYTPTDSESDLKGARCPVAMIWGADSLLMPRATVEYMKGLMAPGSLCIEIPDAHHHVMLDQPLATVTAFRAVLALFERTP